MFITVAPKKMLLVELFQREVQSDGGFCWEIISGVKMFICPFHIQTTWEQNCKKILRYVEKIKKNSKKSFHRLTTGS